MRRQPAVQAGQRLGFGAGEVEGIAVEHEIHAAAMLGIDRAQELRVVHEAGDVALEGVLVVAPDHLDGDGDVGAALEDLLEELAGGGLGLPQRVVVAAVDDVGAGAGRRQGRIAGAGRDVEDVLSGADAGGLDQPGAERGDQRRGDGGQVVW